MTSQGFTVEQRRVLEKYFTNLDRPVFGLRNLPEVVKGALFARYSRSSKDLRRLFLEEFLDTPAMESSPPTVGRTRAAKLLDRVFFEYGDDSVAQLSGVHLACEGASNIFTKLLERGRIMTYLEQSTRYVSYADRTGNRWKYKIPSEIMRYEAVRRRYCAIADKLFETYSSLSVQLQRHLEATLSIPTGTSSAVHKRAIRAKVLDLIRGILPAATQSNLGIFGSAQAFENLLIRLQAYPLAEACDYATMMLHELRQLIPEFMTRVDREDRGIVWSQYLKQTREAMRKVSASLPPDRNEQDDVSVRLTDFDPDGEVKVAAAALFTVSQLSETQLLDIVRRMDPCEREAIIRTYAGDRANRRHKPGRAFECTRYRFEIVCDYGAFRDLQRHRLLTIDWQPLTTYLGHTTPQEITHFGLLEPWDSVMAEAASVYTELLSAVDPLVAAYVIPMAYRLRFYMDMNAREAMHVIELRTARQGHSVYRKIGQQMHELILNNAGHRAIASAMQFVDYSSVDLGRLDAEQASELAGVSVAR